MGQYLGLWEWLRGRSHLGVMESLEWLGKPLIGDLLKGPWTLPRFGESVSVSAIARVGELGSQP